MALLSVRELAEELNLSATTVYRMAQTGTIPAEKWGRVWRFDLADVKQARREQDPWRRSNQARARRGSKKAA